MSVNITDNIYTFPVKLPRNPLQYVNCYVIKATDGGRNLLIDTGFNRPDCLKMLLEGIRGGEAEEKPGVGLAALLVQGVATSIDALSVGFTIAHYRVLEALLCALIIAAVTFVICFAGLQIGKKAGTRLAGKAGILGGAILIFIGIEIFVSSLL